MPSVLHPSRCLEKCEIPTVSEFNKIRRGSYISRDDSNGEVRLVIRDLEKFRIFTEITILPFLRKSEFFGVSHYVDNIIFGATNVSFYEEFSKSMHSEFEMSMMGELNFFLGLQIKQLKEDTFINQTKYVRDLLKKYNLEEVTTKSTPMGSSIKLDMDKKGKPIDQTKYRGMIGSLLYLTTSRPNIMYSICLCARFQECPK